MFRICNYNRIDKYIWNLGVVVQQGIVESRKNFKRNRIISAVRYHENISRHDVKKMTGYSMTTVLNIINDLVEQHWLVEEDCINVRAGRRPTWLHINPDGFYTIGVEFNADRMISVVTDFSFAVIYTAEQAVSLNDTAEQLVEKIKSAIHDAMEFMGSRKNKVIGIGLGLPGSLDRAKGVGLEYAHLNSWKNVPIRNLIEKEFGCRVLIENNINTMALAYRWEKYKEYADDFVLISLRYGIRMGMVINNKLFVGAGNAGEIGHIKLPNGTRFCSCGKIGCLDTEASFKAIRNKILERMESGRFSDIKREIDGDPNKITMGMFVDSVQRGNKDAQELLAETAACLGQSLAMVLGTINPRRIIIASKSGMGGKAFSEVLYATLRENAPSSLLENCHVDCIKVSDNMGAVGAAMLVMEDELQVVDENV